MRRLVAVLGLAFVACGGPSGIDAGAGDAGAIDASVVDAGAFDAGVSDAGSSDAGGSDAGAGDAGCWLVALPTPLAFADTTVGCRTERALSVWNRCAAGVGATPSTQGGSGFTVDAGALVVPARAMVDVPVWFAPQSAGAAQGQVVLTTSGLPQQPLLATPLRGTGRTSASRADTWTQPTRPRIDVLFVVSDGPGMAAAQQSLQQNLVTAWQYATATNLDVRGHVLVGRGDGGAPVSSASAPSVVLGDQGQPTTSCLARAVEALHDGTWLRPTDRFAVVCVQNTLEQPVAGSPAAWLRALGGTVYGLAQFAPGCANDDVVLGGYIDATGGSRESLCGSDGGLGLSSLFTLNTRFALTSPIGGDGGLEVRIDTAVVPGGSYTFDATRREVVFAPLFAPAPGATVQAIYEAACAP